MTEKSITSPQGFLAGAVASGIKASGELDLALLASEVPCAAAGVFTSNRFQAAPVILSRRRIRKGSTQAIVVNSGCANAATGPQGLRDAREMARLAARRLGLEEKTVLVASTGVIGQPLPMTRVRSGIDRLDLSREGGHAFARAIMTTDPFPKEEALTLNLGGHEATIAGAAKGAGMIHPNLATMLAFIATDAAAEASFLQPCLRRAVDSSFNMLTIDGDTSPNDCLLLLANGLAGHEPLKEGTPEAAAFEQGLTEVCLRLARAIARGGEGATRLLEVKVEGAFSLKEARLAARTIASSPLVKSAVFGQDPNWGRILAALGRSGARFRLDRVEVFLGQLCVFRDGAPLAFGRAAASELMGQPEVLIRVLLHLGSGQATAWGCDLTPEYVKINSAYTT